MNDSPAPSGVACVPDATWEAFQEFVGSVAHKQRTGRDAMIQEVMKDFFASGQHFPALNTKKPAATSAPTPGRKRMNENMWAGHQRSCQRFLEKLQELYPQGMPAEHQAQLTYPDGLVAWRALRQVSGDIPRLSGVRASQGGEARPMDLFVRMATLPQLRALLKLGINPNAFSSLLGTTPLGRCCLEADWRRARVLLQAGADVHIVTRPEHTGDPGTVGATMLYRTLFKWRRAKDLPAWPDRKALLETLLEFGADPMARRADGHSVMDAAGEEEAGFLTSYLASQQLDALEAATTPKRRARKARL